MQGVLAADGGGHFMTLLAEPLRQIVAQIVVVIDEQQFMGRLFAEAIRLTRGGCASRKGSLAPMRLFPSST